MGNGAETGILLFGDFEADLQVHELRKGSSRLPLQEKVFHLLTTLLEKAGEIVSREELRSALWPAGTHVDFDHNLNNAIAKLRVVLHDPAEKPHYIETVGSRGYRFIAPVRKRPKLPETGDRATIRLAVLPFDDLSDPPLKPYFSIGLVDEVITRLGHVFPRRLGVIARASVLSYAGKKKNISQIGKQLRVTYVLDGTVQRENDLIRITVQLIRVRDQTQQWASEYNYRLTKIFPLQAEVADRITQALGVELLSDYKTATARVPTNADGYVFYLKGRYHQGKRTTQSLQDSIRHFEKAIELDPEFVPAYSSLAISLALLGGLSGGAPAALNERARVFAHRAIQMDDTLAESHTALALMKYSHEWDFRSVERLLRQAIHLNPSDAYAYQLQGHYLGTKGMHSEAILSSKRACDIDPLSISANIALGISYYLARDFSQALAAVENAVQLDQTSGHAWMWRATMLSQSGQFGEAAEGFRRARECDPENPRFSAWSAESSARGGNRSQALRILEQLHLIRTQRYVCPLDIALVHAGLGEHEEAAQWIERAFEERTPLLVLLLGSDPRLDAVRDHPRVRKVIESVGIPSLQLT